MSEETITPTPDPSVNAPAMDPNEIEAGKTFAILSYIIGILCIVPLIQKDNAFSLYHAKQVLLLMLAGVALSFLISYPALDRLSGDWVRWR